MRDYEYSDLYFDAHLDKQMQIEVLGTGITIDNSMIELDAFELDEMLCSEQELTFGSCEANCVKFTARDMPGSIVGKTIRITETVDGNTDVPFQYGIYKVYSDVPSSDRTKREITAYDAMYDIVNADVKSWYAGLTFPMTLRQFRDSFFAHFGIMQKETTLVNDAMTVNKTLVAEQADPDSTITAESAISGKAIVEAICEINGVFGNINRDGQFEYVELKEIVHPLYPANDLYPSDNLFPRDPNTISMTGHYITFDYEDFQTKQITQLEIRPSDDSAGAVVGTSGNTYAISGNFLVSDKTGTELEAIAANTLSIIRKASYTPLKSSEVVGNPCIELGDPIRFNTTREIVESYVLQRTLTGIQNKRDSIVSSGTETYNQNPNGIKGQIANMQHRTNKLERTAEHTLSEIHAVDEKVDSLNNSTVQSITDMNSKIEQTASSIRLEVSQSITTVDANAQGYASDAENNANASTDEKLKSYATTEELSSQMKQTADSIALEVSALRSTDDSLSEQISQNSDAITQEVTDRENAVSSVDGKLELKIDKTDDGTIVSLINGSASRINFNATNMFTVDSPNLKIDPLGNVSVGGVIVSDTNFYISNRYAGSGGIEDAPKVACMGIGTGHYTRFYINENGINQELLNTDDTGEHLLFIANDESIPQIIVGAQIMAESIFGSSVMCHDFATDWFTLGGKRAYKCCGSYGSYAIPSMEMAAKRGDPDLYGCSQNHAGYMAITQNIYRMSCSPYGDFYTESEYGVYMFSSSSDEKLKTDIHDSYIRASEVVNQICHRAFSWKADGKKVKNGYIAQELEKIDENMVNVKEDQNGVKWYSVNNLYMTSLCTKAIQEQQEEIESLKRENLALQNKISILEQKMEVLENVINNKINQS